MADKPEIPKPGFVQRTFRKLAGIPEAAFQDPSGTEYPYIPKEFRDPGSTGGGKGRRRDNKERDSTEFKKAVEENAKWLEDHLPIVRYLAGDFQTYVPPIGYEARTDDHAKNEKINAWARDWTANCDYTEMRSFYEMLGLLEWGKTRDGRGALVFVEKKGTPHLTLQSISAERIGNPSSVCDTEAAYYPPKLPASKRNRSWYFDGIEFDARGIPVKIHVWKRIFTPPKTDTVNHNAIAAQILSKGSEGDGHWTYDTAFDWESTLYAVNTLDPEDFSGKSDLEPAIKHLTSALNLVRGATNQAEFYARLAGFLTGGDGEVDDLPGGDSSGEACESCGGAGCSECGPSVFRIGEFLEIWGIPEGKAFLPSPNSTDSDTLVTLLENFLFASAPTTCHIPPSFIGLKGKSLQGTDTRTDLDKALQEFKRRRRAQATHVKKAFRAAFLAAKANGNPLLKEIALEDILSGEWTYVRDITPDFGKMASEIRKDYEKGLASEDDVNRVWERSGTRVAAANKRGVNRLLADMREQLGEDWVPSPEMLLQLYRGIIIQAVQEPAEEEDIEEPPTEEDDE